MTVELDVGVIDNALDIYVHERLQFLQHTIY